MRPLFTLYYCTIVTVSLTSDTSRLLCYRYLPYNGVWHGQPTLDMDPVRGTTAASSLQWNAICLSPMSSLTHSCTCIRIQWHVMNGTLLYVTRPYVACFVFLWFNSNFLLDNNIQNVETFHKHSAHVGQAIPAHSAGLID